MERIYYNVDDPNGLDLFLKSHKREISYRLSKNLIEALENNIDDFTFAEIKVVKDGDPEEPMTILLNCHRDDYLDSLEKQLVNMTEFEEYELCTKLKEWIDYMKVERNVQKNG